MALDRVGGRCAFGLQIARRALGALATTPATTPAPACTAFTVATRGVVHRLGLEERSLGI